MLSSNVAAEISYLCVSDRAVGFGYEKAIDGWVEVVFKTNHKFIVSKSSLNGFTWEAKDIGNKHAHMRCKNDFSEGGIVGNDIQTKGDLFCHHAVPSFGQMNMNKNNGRYLQIYPTGYWNDRKSKEGNYINEGANTPYIEIGKCSPL